MNKIEKLEQIKKENDNFRSTGIDFEKYGVNPTFFWEYENSLEAGNNTINFEGIIWDNDVEPIVKHCKEFGLKTFTVSCTCSGVIKTLGTFEDLGCKVIGMKKVNSKYTTFSGKREVLSAIEVQVKEA